MKAAIETGVSTEHIPVVCKPSKQVNGPVKAEERCSLPFVKSADRSRKTSYVYVKDSKT